MSVSVLQKTQVLQFRVSNSQISEQDSNACMTQEQDCTQWLPLRQLVLAEHRNGAGQQTRAPSQSLEYKMLHEFPYREAST